MHFPAKAVDLADTFNKYCAAALGKTTLRSQNGEHGLNHIAIHTDYAKTWDITSVDNHYTMTCPFSEEQLNEVQEIFKNKKSFNMSVKNENGRLTVKFHKIHLEEIADLYNETDIKIQYHNKDHEIIEAGYAEIRLQQLIKAPWFKRITGNRFA